MVSYYGTFKYFNPPPGSLQMIHEFYGTSISYSLAVAVPVRMVSNSDNPIEDSMKHTKLVSKYVRKI